MPEKWPRRFCCDEDLALIGYDGRDASSDLASLQTRGPRRPTQELIDVIIAEGVDGSLVLDIGAGVGAIHLALLEAGARRAVDVDASREYLAAAREEAHRRGLDERVEYRYGDVVELVDELPQADIVVLDSVICCYPYLPALLNAAIEPGPAARADLSARHLVDADVHARLQRNTRAGTKSGPLLHLPAPGRLRLACRGRLLRGP